MFANMAEIQKWNKKIYQLWNFKNGSEIEEKLKQ